LGGALLGWRTVCAVELDAYCRRVLLSRQRDGHLPRFPIWDDVRTFDGRPWHGHVDVVSGGFPCVDISIAGRGAGLAGEHSGLWMDMARIIREVGPRFVFVENSPVLTARGLGRVLGDLAGLGFDAEWGVFSACAQDAPHTRERLFLVAHARAHGSQTRQGFEGASITERPRGGRSPVELPVWGNAAGHSWWLTEPSVDRVADGVAHRLDRVGAIGNGQVPAVAATAWRMLNA
jgi:DNA (cytosine-5)-methyltransferase 1